MGSREFDWEKVKLDSYEQEIEANIEKAQPVGDEAYWKELLIQTARNTLKDRRLVLEFHSRELKEKALRILKENLGEEFQVISE